jgi:TorA maturation chaperone TorD
MDLDRIPEALLTEAAAWRLAGLLFERPVPGWHERVADLAEEVKEPALRDAVNAAQSAVEGHYLALFGPGGPASPRAAAYVGLGDPGRSLAEVRAFYEAFAYHPSTEDPPDHLSVAAGFVGYLRLKEAFALGLGNDEAAGTVQEARERFEREHLARIAVPLARKLKEHAPGSVWAAAAAWMGSGLETGQFDKTFIAFTDSEETSGGCFACGGDPGD